MIRLQQLLKALPHLDYQTVKGNSGLVGVIGGSFQYTGAPFYAAMSALKMGADLAHIFCSKQAAIPIKIYSPQLIVHPVFDYQSSSNQQLDEKKLEELTNKWVEYFKIKINRINSWVIGPGLGRGKHLQNFFAKFITMLPPNTKLVIDADGLYYLSLQPQLIQNLQKLKCVLTPNHREFFHLNKFLKIDDQTLMKEAHNSEKKIQNDQVVGREIELKQNYPITIIIKGQKDIVLHQNSAAIVDTLGGMKRCGGIGDVLSGCVAACINWNYQIGPILACHVTKLASKKAFEKHGRSLTGLGVMEQVQEVIKEIQKK